MVGLTEEMEFGASGDVAELEAIMARHEGALLRYARRLLHDPDAAQDVVQDVFIKLCRRWRSRAREEGRLKNWLFRVAHNRAVDHIRRESRLKVLHEAQGAEQGTSHAAGQRQALERKEAMALALRFLRELKPAEQQVVLLRMQQGMSYREISAVTKRSEGNVGCILHHALKKLAARLAEVGAV